MTGRAGAGCASVAVPVPVRREFTYRVPERMREGLRPGARVDVRLGPRKLRGTVVKWPAHAPDGDVELREIERVHTQRPLPEELLALTRFVSDYYLCSWGEAIEAALPPDTPPARPEVWVARASGAREDRIPARARAQRRVWGRLPPEGGELPLTGFSPAERRALTALADRGLAVRVERPSPGRFPLRPDGPPPPALQPTPDQQRVLDRVLPSLDAGRYRPYLLYGATGSGKTEVYLRLAEACLASGRSVLYLVPEIGLTPLLVSRLARRFPDRVAVLHSGLPARQRRQAWDAVAAGAARFVLGTRSAVFAPLHDPGLIVVDEEQDGSYKQEDAPRYNGRDLAVVRARQVGATLLLGSATPSVESFHNARGERYELLRLGGRVERRPLPDVALVDMREEYRAADKVQPLSRPLTRALTACIERGEQALVLRNRRGWAVALLCPRCGDRIDCDRCSITLTWHRRDDRLRCHACGMEQRLPDQCPRCGAAELSMLGQGSERIEDELRRALPGVRIERLDRDVTRRRGAHAEILARFEHGEIDVLVGTQMIAKGHDFPNVTLVGVLSADQTLGLPDFRAAERTFQLLTQVAGRAGRGNRPGRVVVQAFEPTHPVIRLAAAQDYEAFFEREIRYRRAVRYPPLTALVHLLVADRESLRAQEWAQVLAESLRAQDARILLAGPGPAPVERIKGRYRWQILARSAGRRRLVAAVDRAVQAVDGVVPRRAIRVDVDPMNLL